MSIQLESKDLINTQQMEVAVNGPDGATHLIFCSGIAKLDTVAHDTYTFLVGPQISRRQSPTFSLTSLIIGVTGMLATAIIQALYVPRLIQTAQQGILLGIALTFIGLWMILVNGLGRAANLPRGLTWLGIVAGVSIILLPVAVIAIGGSAFLNDPSIALSNLLFMFAFAAGVLGFSIGYAVWAILLGRLFLTGKLPMPEQLSSTVRPVVSISRH